MQLKKKDLIIYCALFICCLLYLLYAFYMVWKWRYLEYKSQQRFEAYQVIESYLKENREYRIAMFRTLETISWCESRHNDEAKNPYSSARGRFQIIDSTKELCERNLGRKIDRTNKQDSWDCAVWLYSKYGTAPWKASQHCWNN